MDDPFDSDNEMILPYRNILQGRLSAISAKPPNPGLGATDAGVEEIDPSALFTENQQIWDKRAIGNWLTRPSKSHWSQISGSGRLIFQAYQRSYGQFGPSSDDHTWIALRSKPLVELLRSEELLKGVDGLDQDPPGLDARHIFLRLSKLKERVLELESEAVQTEGPTFADNAKPTELPTAKIVTRAQPRNPNVQPPPFPRPHTWFSLFASVIPTFGDTQLPHAALKAVPQINKPAPPPPLPPLPVPQQLSELLKFIENHYTDLRGQLKRLKAGGDMPYHLLWTMCVPDGIVEGKDEATEMPIGIRVKSWSYATKDEAHRVELFSLRGTTYCWDGKMFRSKPVSIKVQRYKGVVKVKQLPIQELTDGLRANLAARGRLYKQYSGVLHLGYNSFIYIYDRQSKVYLKRQAHGRVMLDTTGFDRFDPNTNSRYDLLGTDYPSLIRSAQKNSIVFPEQFNLDFDFSDDILCLMPPTHLGYSFSAKLWGCMTVDELSEIAFSENAFDRLVLSDEYKDIIKSQVETFSLKGSELVSDLVENKGGGMVMVLHGKPGTGKTLTAEAISDHLKCPLYMISSGELGQTVERLEKQLRDIMTMSASWNAIVLIDEADVFLEARSRFDSMRNSKVSVFLRLLEYHTGVLILTSNRIRTFDRAFVSRFTIALHYPDLDQDSRLLIWREFLGRAQVEIGDPQTTMPSGPKYISHEDIMKLANKPMNGRVIKQLIRGAQAIAIAKKEPFGISHLQKVIGLNEKFESDWKALTYEDEMEDESTTKKDREQSMYS